MSTAILRRVSFLEELYLSGTSLFSAHRRFDLRNDYRKFCATSGTFSRTFDGARITAPVERARVSQGMRGDEISHELHRDTAKEGSPFNSPGLQFHFDAPSRGAGR